MLRLMHGLEMRFRTRVLTALLGTCSVAVIIAGLLAVHSWGRQQIEQVKAELSSRLALVERDAATASLALEPTLHGTDSRAISASGRERA
jgi:hypothetical protein